MRPGYIFVSCLSQYLPFGWHSALGLLCVWQHFKIKTVMWGWGCSCLTLREGILSIEAAAHTFMDVSKLGWASLLHRDIDNRVNRSGFQLVFTIHKNALVGTTKKTLPSQCRWGQKVEEFKSHKFELEKEYRWWVEVIFVPLLTNDQWPCPFIS